MIYHLTQYQKYCKLKWWSCENLCLWTKFQSSSVILKDLKREWMQNMLHFLTNTSPIEAIVDNAVKYSDVTTPLTEHIQNLLTTAPFHAISAGIVQKFRQYGEDTNFLGLRLQFILIISILRDELSFVRGHCTDFFNMRATIGIVHNAFSSEQD